MEEISKSKTESDVDTNCKVEGLASNDDHAEQSNKLGDADILIKAAHLVEKHEENLGINPTLNAHGEDDSEEQLMANKKEIKRTLKGQGPKFQQHDAKSQNFIQYKPTKPSIKPSKSCETLTRNFTKPSGRYRAIQRPAFHKSSGNIDISVHIYEAVPDIQTSKDAQMFNSHTNTKFPTRKGPCLSKETLRAGYKHREPPPDPKKAQSKESIDIVHTDSSVSSGCHSNNKSGISQQSKPTIKADTSRTSYAQKSTSLPRSNKFSFDHTCTNPLSSESANEQTSDTSSSKHASAGIMAKRKLHRQYKHRPPLPTIRLQDVEPNLPSKGQSSIQVCNTSSSDSSSTSEDVLSFLWSKGEGIEVPTKVGQAVGITQCKNQHESDVVYQLLNTEAKAPLTLYESLNKCSDVRHTEPGSVSGDKSDQVAGNINAQESRGQTKCHEIRKGTDEYLHSDSEDDYMPLVPQRKKNMVVVEYESLHFVQRSQ